MALELAILLIQSLSVDFKDMPLCLATSLIFVHITCSSIRHWPKGCSLHPLAIFLMKSKLIIDLHDFNIKQIMPREV